MRRARARAQARHRGPRVHPGVRPRLPARRGWPPSCWATSAPTAPASPASSTASTATCAATTASAAWSRTRSATRSSCARSSAREHGDGRPAHARRRTIQDQTEEVLAEVGETWQPKGATALVMDPRHGRDPRARQLAARERQQALRGARLRDDEPRGRARPTSPARPSRRSRSPARSRTARSRRTRRSTSRRCSRSPTARSPTPTRAAGRRAPRAGILAESSNVGAALIGRRIGARRFDQWVRRFGFGKPTGVDLPGEESGILLTYDEYSGSTAANMADGPGPRRHADADGRRLRRDRQRRHPAPAAHRRGRRRQAARRSRAGAA